MVDKTFKGTITAKGTKIAVLSKGTSDDYISLTDIAKYKNVEEPFIVVNNWMRVRNTIEYLGIWEKLNNAEFKPIEFDRFLHEAGANAFTLSPTKWVTATNALGIIVKAGRGGGVYAHKDIAFKFASWISAEFELYIIKDYQRLKADENSRISLDWNVKRILAKVNYRIHTDAIRDNLIPPELTPRQRSFIYADEADLLNTALFGMTAAEWRKDNVDKKGNIRDYATIEQLLVLANLENVNALYINNGMPQSERLLELNRLARSQMAALLSYSSVKKLKVLDEKAKLSKILADKENTDNQV
ncbi:MAG: KilA-N domain-containing protein [Oscillospiraceae bacterium]|nr:KilA-N domain-containing protein [Oscillospiraceae bacterium]